MDNKGFISIEYIFALFIIIIIASGMLFYASATIQSSFNIEDDVTHRLILDSLANDISQVNSNGVGYSKYVKLPSEVGYYEITLDKNKLMIEYSGKKGETMLPLINIDSKYKLISGKAFYISKNDNGKIVIT